MLTLLLTALTSCSSPMDDLQQMQNPVNLYFLCETVTYGTQDGVLRAQVADLGTQTLDVAAFLQFYFNTAAEDGLVSPFPQQTQVLNVSLDKDTVALQLGGGYAELSGIQATLTDACLAKTLLEYTEADKLLLTVSDAAGQTVRSKKIAESDMLTVDDSSDTSSISLTLYFTDSNMRYLIPERRTVPYMTEAELPKYIVSQLVGGPTTNGLQKTLPKGTRLLDINVDNGICAVDFSADFLNNCPQTAYEERMTILSVVNSLTDLESVEQVQFYVEGRRQDTYLFLNLSEPFVSDPTAIGPARTDLNELDATVYLPVSGTIRLYAMSMRLKAGSENAAQTVLQQLSEFAPKNGLANPLYRQPLPTEIAVSGTTCVLNYPAGTTFGTDTETELAAIRMLTASLTALDGITALEILTDGAPARYTFNNLPQTLAPRAEWYCSEPIAPAP